MTPSTLRDELVKVCLRREQAESDEPHAYYDAELEYCDSMIDEIAVKLTEALKAPTPLDAGVPPWDHN